jgi:hypothetical protein
VWGEPQSAGQVSSEPTCPANNSRADRVDPPGVEPGLPVCRTGVIPLDHRPISCRAQWNRGESNPAVARAKRNPRPRAAPVCAFRVSRSRSSKLKTVRSWNFWNVKLGTPENSDRSGSRTHTGQILDLPALPIGLPGRVRGANQSQARDSNPDAGLIRPSRAPARPRSRSSKFQVPTKPTTWNFWNSGTWNSQIQLRTRELNPAIRLMRPDRAPARPQYWRFHPSGDGGIRTHTVHVLSVTTPTSWSTSPVFKRGTRSAERGTENQYITRAPHFSMTRRGIEPLLTG